MAKLKDLWIEQAACVGTDPEIWFTVDPASFEYCVAVSICKRCEVRRPCYESAIMRREHYGIWGGIDFTTLDRRRRKAPINF
jgi:WhiB family redox-sensing transcriptional regulator